MRSISIQDIYEAYRKLKNYYYYDNSSLHTRIRIATFEEDFFRLDKSKFKKEFQKKCSNLLAVLNNEDKDDQIFNNMLDDISYYLVPKGLKEENNDVGLTYISNMKEKNNIQIDQYNVMIDAPVEIHLISTLWLMFVGVHLSKLAKAHNYAYNFTLFTSSDDEKQYLNTGLQLYSPYYKGYQDWRDNALKKAENILDSKKNATIISLDIQRYFYNVRINLPVFIDNAVIENNIEFPTGSKALINRLTDLLHRIHKRFQCNVEAFFVDLKEVSAMQEESTLLPVGLLSSGLIGNLYLYEFDRLVMQNLRPDYYGRYVDDILLVLGETKAYNDVSEFLSTYFTDAKRGILIPVEDNNEEGEEKDLRYKLAGYDGLYVQQKKLIIQNFVHYESRAAIKKFRNNITKQRSEFRFLPDEDVMEKDFEESAFKIDYSGSVNTFHSIKDFKGDKFGASTYLAHSIFLACYDNEESKKSNTERTRQILSFFKGNVAIEYYSLWEKVATYFVICKDVDALNMFQANVVKAINALDYGQAETLSCIKKSLEKLLQYSVAMPISMHLKFIAPSNEFEEECYEMAKAIRHANLFRHPFMGVAGLNLTDCIDDDTINLYDTSSPNNKTINMQRGAAMYLTPHHVHFDDINQIKYLAVLMNAKSGSFSDKINKDLVIAISDSKKFFDEINFKWKELFVDHKQKQKSEFVDVHASECCNNSAQAMYVTIKEPDFKDRISVDKSVAIANIKVEDDIIEKMALGKVNLSKAKRKDLFGIINDAAENECDILVLPELSVPFQWLDLMARESRKHNMAIICGLSYYVNASNIAFNTVVAILPVKTKYYTTSVIVPRVKNYYAPLETQMLTSYGYHYPRTNKSKPTAIYDLIHWRKCYFSFYDCFELASIEDRSLFKSKVDFIVATELNRDVNYYSEIVGSWVRDIHCYIIQVNTSNYGDSRIMKPASKEQRDQIIVKGGRNATMLYDIIEIDKLRKFQLPGYFGQDKLGGYKKTPPQLSRTDVDTRIKDKEFK